MKNNILLIIFALVIAPVMFAQEAVEKEAKFHNFNWGTSYAEFTAKMGNPAVVDEVNGLKSLVYGDLRMLGYEIFMVVYFSQNGLEGGTYYFNTLSAEERIKCYKDMQIDLQAKYGTARVLDMILREAMPHESSWALDSGYVQLTVDTRRNDPVTLWFSSPWLTNKLFPGRYDDVINTSTGKFTRTF